MSCWGLRRREAGDPYMVAFKKIKTHYHEDHQDRALTNTCLIPGEPSASLVFLLVGTYLFECESVSAPLDRGQFDDATLGRRAEEIVLDLVPAPEDGI